MMPIYFPQQSRRRRPLIFRKELKTTTTVVVIGRILPGSSVVSAAQQPQPGRTCAGTKISLFRPNWGKQTDEQEKHPFNGGFVLLSENLYCYTAKPSHHVTASSVAATHKT